MASTDFGSASRIPSVKRSAKLALVGSTEDTEVTASLFNVLTPARQPYKWFQSRHFCVLAIILNFGLFIEYLFLTMATIVSRTRYKCTDSLTNSYIIYGLWPNTTYSVNASLIQDLSRQ
jgi:hypothetical protein